MSARSDADDRSRTAYECVDTQPEYVVGSIDNSDVRSSTSSNLIAVAMVDLVTALHM